MKDWKAIARANCPELPDRDLERMTAPLEALEASFRPLVRSLAIEDEPAVTFRPAEEP